MSSHFLAKFRSDRFMKTEAGWLVRTREDRNLGPFRDKESAERALNNHIRVANYTATAIVPEGFEIHDVTRCRTAGCADCEEARAALSELIQPSLQAG